MTSTKQQAAAEAAALGIEFDYDSTTEDEIRALIADRQAGDGNATPHSDEDAPESTRDDLHDQGVPMLAGDPREPVGPEDALGVGEKRGDYSDRIEGRPHTAVALEGAGEPVRRWVDRETGAAAEEGADGAIEVTVDLAPTSTIVDQRPRASDRGGSDEVLKGGVQTDPAFAAGALGIPAAAAAPSVDEAA
jgi:hypothetical protein